MFLWSNTYLPRGIHFYTNNVEEEEDDQEEVVSHIQISSSHDNAVDMANYRNKKRKEKSNNKKEE